MRSKFYFFAGIVLPWDSNFPLSHRVNRDCHDLFSFSNETEHIASLPDWGCWDLAHPHHQVNQVNAQMLLNFLCNTELQSQQHQESYCCEAEL